jgi:large subunit ribosomal protein MRP49
MIVNRTNESGPATMTLYFRDSISDTPPAKDGPETVSSMDGLAKAPEPAEGERTVTIDMKAQLSGDILKEFMEKTGAVPVMPTPQEDAELRDLEDLHRRGEIDRERMRRTLEAERREAALVAAARNEAASLKSST